MKKNFLVYSVIFISIILLSSGFISYDYFPNFGMSVCAESVRLRAPLDFKASEVTKTTIKLTWKRVDGADAYKVFIFNSETDEYESYKTVKDTSCTANGLSGGTTYKFKVAALKSNNGKYTVQDKSEKLVVKTLSSKKIPAPQNIKMTVQDYIVNISWDDVDGADAYRISIYDSDFDYYEPYKIVKSSFCTIDDLDFDKTYKIMITTLVKEDDIYIDQKSKTISVKLNKSSVTTKKKKLKQFKVPNAGDSIDDVLKNSGMVNVTNQGKSSTYSYNYTGDAIAYGEECFCLVSFNSKKQCCSFVVGIPQNYSEYKEFLSLFVTGYGSNYTISYTSDGNLMYVWQDRKMWIGITYLEEEKNTTLAVLYLDYLD